MGYTFVEDACTSAPYTSDRLTTTHTMPVEAMPSHLDPNRFKPDRQNVTSIDER